MNRYKDNMNQIKFTEEEKNELIEKVKVSANSESKQPKSKVRPIVRTALVATLVCTFTVTTFATDVLQSVVDVLSPMFGVTPVQTEIIDKIGRPIAVSETHDGITFSVDAIIGDRNNLCIVYSISGLPDDVKYVYFKDNKNGTFMNLVSKMVIKGAGGSSIEQDVIEEKVGTIQYVERMNFDGNINKLKKVEAVFVEPYYTNAEGVEVVLSDETWNLEFELDYEDTSEVIKVNEVFEQEGLTYTVEKITISPLSISVDYTIDGIPEKEDYGFENSAFSVNQRNGQKIYSALEFKVNKVNGEEIDLTYYSGISYGRKGLSEIVKCHKQQMFDKIIPLNEIKSITVGELEIEINKE